MKPNSDCDWNHNCPKPEEQVTLTGFLELFKIYSYKQITPTG